MITAREVTIPNAPGKRDPLGHDVALKIDPKCPDSRGYEDGELVRLVLCEWGWGEDKHLPVSVTKFELGHLIDELQKLHAEMTSPETFFG